LHKIGPFFDRHESDRVIVSDCDLDARQHDAALLRNEANLAVAHGIVPLNDWQRDILAQILTWLIDWRAL